MVVEKNDKVFVHYTGKFEDGEVFDSSEGHDSLPFVVGANQVVKGFDDAVLGMKEGEEKTITIKPEEGYGMPNEKMIHKFPRDKLPKDPEPQVGMMLMLHGPNNQQIPGKITNVEEDGVTIDLNHPLAGKTLVFTLKIDKIEKAAKE